VCVCVCVCIYGFQRCTNYTKLRVWEIYKGHLLQNLLFFWNHDKPLSLINMLSGFCGDKPTKFNRLWHSVGLCISDSDGTFCPHFQGRHWRWRQCIALTKLYGVTVHNITFWRCLFSGVATQCFCLHYEIFWSNIHTSFADTHWQLIRLGYSHTNVSYHEVTVSSNLYGYEIWTAKETDKKINWVHEIRFVKYCYGERILDSAKNVRRNVKVRSYFVLLFRVYMCFAT